MQFQVRLLHCDGGNRVVRVTAREGERFLGSALGEAGHAEEAEDRARARLLASLGLSAAPPQPRVGAARGAGRSEPHTVMPPLPSAPSSLPRPPEATSPQPHGEATGSKPRGSSSAQPTAQTAEPPASDRREEDPEDWSAELARLDLQMRRLGWDREREGLYLQRAFGHPSRDRITAFADLMAYLQAIEVLEPGCDPASATLPLRRSDLLEQSDLLLRQLGWDGGRGRRFLEQHLGVSSRQQLKDIDLLRFNMLLEEETLQAAQNSCPAQGLQA